ncbi:MAG: shikimate kinase [Ruminococcaceae bacterium]|nr:shikimate kinase [Oscillospiraceae bacterium]
MDNALRIGLIGGKLGHSYSPEIHALLGMTYPYELREVAPAEIGAFLDTNPYDGFNVTIPYKKDIIPYLCGMSETAARLGSVNTVLRTPDGWWGDNTDYDGFTYMVRRTGYHVRGKKAVVIGSGGVSPTVAAVLSDLGAAPVVVLSHKDNTPEMRSLHADARVVVNTSPVGMYPNNGTSPVPADAFPAMECALDLIYNPFETAFLADARERGCVTESGISMLVAQAKRGAELFTGTDLDDALCDRVTAHMIASRRNLILIGMPGCGKSTVGRQAAKRLGRAFVDLDAEIEAAAGKPIPQIFAEDGEEGFRALEHRVISEVCRRSSLVIATGGGCVTRRENYRPMAQNGVLLWLHRDIAQLPTKGRPLSQKHTPAALYEVRRPLYEAFADTKVDNSETITKAVEQVLAAFSAVPDRLRT